mmetsp:Transcript_91450/g.284487  ORF Transcript_91450/g.284487 Transcript_91450/m.284487 type:complete len:946 (+) Transcript_91450:536-3373(+)
MVGETHAAHRAAHGIAAEVAEAQQQILSDLLTSMQTGSERLRNLLGAIAAEAREASEADQTATASALDTIDAACSSVMAAAAKVKTEANAAAARGNASIEQQAAALCEDLDSGREVLSAAAGQAVEDLSGARATASKAHELACKRLEGTIREPLADLKASLEEAARLLGSHASGISALLAQEAESAKVAADSRHSLVRAMGEATSAHEASTAARSKALGRVHEKLGAVLESRSQATSALLASLGDRLGASRASLAEVMQRGSASVTSAVAGGDAALSAAWGAESTLLDNLGATLARAAADQRAGNAVEAVDQGAANAALALTTALASAIQELTAARGNVAGQVAELQEQRTAEQDTIELLRQQRESLQADVASLRSTLESAKSELAKGRSQGAALQAAQEQRRRRALDAVASLLTSELSSLGAELDTGVESICSCLDGAAKLAAAAADTATDAEEGNVKLGREVAHVASEWSQGVNVKCGAISAAQERAREAAEAVGAASAAAAEQLGDVRKLSAEWGRTCDQVGQLIDEASGHQCSLRAGLEKLQPEWKAATDQVREALETWAEGGRHVDDALGLVASDGTDAGGELGRLCKDVDVQRSEAVEGATAWEEDGRAHKVALDDLTKLGASLAEEACKTERQRGCTVEGLGREASDLCSRASQSCTDTTAVLGAVATHAEAMPVDFAASDAALAEAAATMGAVSSRAAATFASASEAVARLRAAHAEAASTVCEGVASTADTMASAAKAGGCVAVAHRKATAAAAEHAREQWRRAEEERGSTLASLDAAMQSAKDSAAAAARAGNERLLIELENGGRAKETSAGAVEGLSSGVATALTSLQTALHSGMAAEPLAAFTDGGGPGIPACPLAAQWPDIEILPRPNEEQLSIEFRQTRSCRQGEENLVENTVPSPLVAAKDPDKGAIKDARLGSGERAPRRVLGELNQAE